MKLKSQLQHLNFKGQQELECQIPYIYANAAIVGEANIVEPETFEEALHDSQWIAVMKEDIDVLERS